LTVLDTFLSKKLSTDYQPNNQRLTVQLSIIAFDNLDFIPVLPNKQISVDLEIDESQ